MWGRLSLRWQVALAVLVPSIVISVLSGVYFPPQAAGDRPWSG